MAWGRIELPTRGFSVLLCAIARLASADSITYYVLPRQHFGRRHRQPTCSWWARVSGCPGNNGGTLSQSSSTPGHRRRGDAGVARHPDCQPPPRSRTPGSARSFGSWGATSAEQAVSCSAARAPAARTIDTRLVTPRPPKSRGTKIESPFRRWARTASAAYLGKCTAASTAPLPALWNRGSTVGQ